MPTPTKPVIMLESEKKSHRTKKELAGRQAAEKALLSGTVLKERPEVKANKAAHKEFLRVNALLVSIGKNDAIYEIVINRYCLLVAECSEMEGKIKSAYDKAAQLEIRIMDEETESDEIVVLTEAVQGLYGVAIALEKQLQTKRKMLFDIERENIMTIASALRSIPKKEEKQQSALLAALGDG